jgi:hypothetical protein
MDDTYFWVLLVVGFWAIIWYWVQRVRRDVEQIHEDVQRLINKIIFMRVEKHSNVIFAYNALNNEFVCQGKNMDELSQHFGSRFPGHKGVIVKPDEVELK